MSLLVNHEIRDAHLLGIAQAYGDLKRALNACSRIKDRLVPSALISKVQFIPSAWNRASEKKNEGNRIGKKEEREFYEHRVYIVTLCYAIALLQGRRAIALILLYFVIR